MQEYEGVNHDSTRRLKLRFPVIVVALALHFVADLSPVSAQAPGPDIITLSQLILVPGEETPWPIQVISRQGLPAQIVLLVRGLPAEMRLSEGRSFGTGTWVVPMSGIEKLKVSTSPSAKKGAVLSLSLATLEGTTLVQRNLTAVIGTPAPPAQQSTAAIAELPPQPMRPAVPVAIPPSRPQMSPKDKDAALRLVQRGNVELRTGNLLVARQFFERAADLGLPEGAVAMGATYDPDERASLEGVVTTRPDVKLARKWYEKALDLGDPSASARIQRLSQN